MELSRDGAQHFRAALSPADLAALEQPLGSIDARRPGVRLTAIPSLSDLLCAEAPVGRLAAARLGAAARPVRALLFNKTADRNWSLDWHQDRTIAVRARAEVAGFSNWTVKSGIEHVEPPFDLIERMLTLRIHLDPAGPANAPLLVAPGSHRLGRIPETNIAVAVRRLGTHACLADRGDLWLYSTPILHSSGAAAEPASRRVLQVDHSADALPFPLEWLGV